VTPADRAVPDVTFIVHGHAWPPEPALAELRRAIADACGPAQRLEVREAAGEAVGAAGLVKRALAQAEGTIVVCLEPSVAWQPGDLGALVEAARAGVLARAARPEVTPDNGDAGAPLVQDVALAVRRALEMPDLPRPAPTRPLGWAIRRSLVAEAGGLDEACWLDGGVEELAARLARARVGVRAVPIASVWQGPEAYPLRPFVGRFLAWRHALRLAALHQDPTTLGATLATTAASAIAASWAASGVDASALRYGAPWELRLASPVETLLPLLAIEAFALELPELVARRQPALVGVESPDEAVPADESEPAARLAGARPLAAPPPAPLVSVIVVNWNGEAHLEACLGSLEASDYPADRLEILCVDNGSTDGSVALVERRFPRVKIVRLPANRGFTGGNAAGVGEAAGEVLLFLNNDMRVAPQAVRRLVAGLSAEAPCAAAKVLSWNGRAIDFVRGTISFEGRGFQEHYGEPDRPERHSVATFFPNGGAFAVTRAAYDAAGGFDPALFAYYDDLDLGWRLRLTGADVRVMHDAVAFHRHGATSRRHPAGQKRYLMDRNALWVIFANYGTAQLRRVLGPALVLATVRLLQDVKIPRASALARGLAPFSRRFQAGAAAGCTAADVYQSDATGASAAPEALAVRRLPLEAYAALGHAVAALPDRLAWRTRVQRGRSTPDDAIVPRFGRALEYSSSRASYMAIQDALADALDLPAHFRGTTRVLIVTQEPLAKNIAGPGARALELGRALSAHAQVTVAAPAPPELAVDECTLAPYSYADPSSLGRLAEQADVLVVRGFTLAQFPFLTGLDLPLVIDLYCPFTLEHLEMTASDARVEPERVLYEAAEILRLQNDQLAIGDFFLCASERQRDFWLGALHTAGRLNPHTYGRDATLRDLVDVVPYGLPDEPAAEAWRRSGAPAHPLKGSRPGIGPDDRVLLWGGSMLDWQDPELLVRAVAALGPRRPDLRLFFMGTKHPNPDVKPARVIARSIELARELGVLDRSVFFNDWVKYEERVAYLRDADLGVSTHTDHLETRFSFRTRMLDYIWAGLPIVCTEGDVFADLVRDRRVGLTVPAGDLDALVDAVSTALEPSFAAGCRERLASLGQELRWSVAAAPLARFVARPRFAADRAVRQQRLRRELAQSFGWTKLAKRTALRLGVGEGTIERAKQTPLVRAAMSVRNRLARRRAERRATRP
jgi:hypothetical protein